MAPPRTVPVLLPLALETPYDYLVPEGLSLVPGTFVEVPLGTQVRIGVVWAGPAVEQRPVVDPEKLREVHDVVDVEPLPPVALKFADWVADYTLAPRGMVLRMMMSAPRAFQPPKPRIGYRRTGPAPARLTAARRRVLEIVSDGFAMAKAELADAAGVSPSVIDGLTDAGTLAPEPIPERHARVPDPDREGPELSSEQAAAAGRLAANVGTDEFSVTLLDGVTGSGKTEVYFEAVAATVRAGRQALILLPEIALTSQFVARFEARFGCPPAEWHSDVGAPARGRIWRGVARADIKVVVGARSALFLPFAELGLIVVDEEHDPAFKQEDRVAYQARDMAVVRGSLGRFPVVLSSATPAIESQVNVRDGRYASIRLTERYSGASLPRIQAIDMRETPPERGSWLSPTLLAAVTGALDAGQQALLFLNRRGYAPLTLCRACGHRFECPNCAAWLVAHRFRRRLQCHHCGFLSALPETCPECEAENSTVPCGPGVERIAEEVEDRFPGARTAILSSDLVPNISALRDVLDSIARRQVDLVIGTQLVAKGHHFPGLAVVGVVDGDLGLGQGDPRAAERTYQLLHQVTGRAGREAIAGAGLIQTYMPEHPVIQALVSGDRDRFQREEIAAREAAGYPPFGRLASLLVTAGSRPLAETFARAIAVKAPPSRLVRVLGPAEAPLAVIRGRHRFRLLLKAGRQVDIQAYIRAWLSTCPRPTGGARLSIDIDPYSFM